MPLSKPLLTALLLFFFYGLTAQTNSLYSYQELSHLYYAKQKDSLKKTWICPSLYKDKATQKKYKELWDSRTEGITGAITDDDYVHDKEVYNYIEDILTQLMQANQQLIPVRPFLFIDRSPSVNAYSTGGNILAVNLGLITFAKSREELAFVIAHELSHNILNHVDNVIKAQAEWLTSEEYKKSLNAVLDSKYERLSRLKKVMEGYTFSRNRHQRFKESEADSLAIILVKKSNLAFDAGFFLRLDSSDILYRQPLKYPVKNYFASSNLVFEDAWTTKRSKGLSSRNYNFRDSSSIQDSLKTHPDCSARYARSLSQTTPNAHLSPIPAHITETANKMLIWNMYTNFNLTPCLYRILMEKDMNNTDPWYDFMINNVLVGLYFSDKQLNRFNAIGITPKEYISRSYYELQTMLEQIPREDLEKYCRSWQNAGFWNKMPSTEKALKNLLYSVALDTDDSQKTRSKAAKEFTASYGESMYCELAEDLAKK